MSPAPTHLGPPPPSRAWWKEASVYQIYPSSFNDSNGDGIGDIPGIISKLDYIRKLGVDVVWLCPVFQSPQVDMGYDVADYYQIHPPYGTLEDIDCLISSLHKRNMKLVMDLVVNHTSDQHAWFKQSRSSRSNEQRDWYIWRKPRYDQDGVRQPPNNWRAAFGGSAWEYDEATDEYYLHLFATEQPDLNWDNPRVRFAVHQIMRYWLDKGVSGFRLDVINFISKNPDLPDAPVVNPDQRWQDGSLHYACGPKLHDYLQELGSILKDYNAFSVGEMPCVYDPSEIVKAVGSERNELGMVFQFEIVDLDNGPGGRFSPGTFSLSSLKSIVAKWQDFMYENDGWNALYLENHDQGRSIPRFTLAAPEYRAIAGKMLATFLGLQSGTVFIFQGQEIGMVNVPTSWDISYFRDIEFLNHWNETVQTYPDDLELHITTMKQAYLKSRDNGRTPMQWGPGRFAEFTSGDVPPWISVHDDYKVWNVAAQISDPESVFWYWAKVLKLRKTWADVFVYGKFALVDADNKNLFVYSRSFGEQIALVVLNFSETCVEWEPPKEALPVLARGKILLGNYVKGRSAVSPDTGKMTVRPFEGVVIVRN